MSISVKRVTAYEVDGKVYTDKKQALRAEARKRLEDLVHEGGGQMLLSYEERQQVIEWMLVQEWQLINALSDIARRGRE